LLLEYIERSGDMLTNVVTGKTAALETLFPGGSSHTANWLYKDSALSRYHNAIATAVVREFSHDWPDDQPLRVLEVGAGTGSTTESIIRQLPGKQTVYAFTDVSDFFLAQARTRFAAYPFLRYGLLDLETDPADQGFEPDSFDVIIAANVLHATRNLNETIANVRSLLAPGGLLVLIEVTNPPQWYDVSVSLIEGWQRFDDGLRTDNPLLPVSSWISLLSGAGFEGIEGLPGEESIASTLGTKGIVARAPSAPGVSAVVSLPGSMSVASRDLPQGGTTRLHSEAQGEAARAFLARLDQEPANERQELLVELVYDPGIYPDCVARPD
jgi:epothilone polyketide synthase E